LIEYQEAFFSFNFCLIESLQIILFFFRAVGVAEADPDVSLITDKTEGQGDKKKMLFIST
jgi:hypothetical protein